MQATKSMPATTLGFLDECHDIVLKHLRGHIQKMFENSDTAFLEFAEKSQSSASQLRFFEAMNVIQKNREHVENTFYRELGRSFADFGYREGQDSTPGKLDSDSMELVSKEDTDIQVAVQNMAASASLGSSQELVALRQRLAVLNNGRQLEDIDIPGGPVCLANAFHTAAKDLVLEHQTLLIVYMLFNKFVLSKTTALYDEYNKHLMKAGLLPNLKYQVRIKPERARQKTSQSAHDEAGAVSQSGGNQSLGDELFGNIMQLLSRRVLMDANNSGNTGPSAAHINNPLPQSELVSALHQLQQNSHAGSHPVVENTATTSNIMDSKTLVASLVANLSADRDRLFDGIDRRRLPTADTQIIDLVGMMFEYMLKDDDIPNVAKAELSRLHTPYLKVAIIDKGLFTNTRHPAHELLNMLARASARWIFEDNLERGIFPSVHNVVERVLAEFENNLDIFSELLELFSANVHDMETKSAAIEKRTRQAAEGKEKLAVARNQAATAIAECMDGHNVPAPVKKLLDDVWQEKLMFIYLREPEAANSDSWHLAVQTVDAIIWSVEPRTSIEAQAEHRERLPDVQKQIELSLETLNAYGSTDDESQLALIRDIQDAILNAPITESRETPAATGSQDSDTRETGAACDQDPSQDTAAQAIPTVVSHEAPQDTARQEVEVEGKGITPATAQEHSRNTDTSGNTTVTLSASEQAALSELQQVSFGTWFSIQDNDDSFPARVKLSWFSKLSGNYMFVNSMGMRTQVRKQTELASMIAAGKACIIKDDQQPFVHRALEAIRRMLGSDQKATV